MNKRSVAVNSSSGAAQNSGTVREATAPSVATVLPQPVTTAVGKGALAAQDKSGNFAYLCQRVLRALSLPKYYIISTFLRTWDSFECRQNSLVDTMEEMKLAKFALLKSS